MSLLEEPIQDVKMIENYIDGEWVESEGELKDVMNPATGRVIGKVPISTKKEVDTAIQAAREAYWEWRCTPPVSRARYLFSLKELLEENFEEISRIQSQEHGKTIDESRGETRRGIENVEVACGIPSLMMGCNLEDIASGIDEALIRQPLGTFGVIAPFNFPFMIPLWSIPYAIATGNTVVVNPSSEVPLSHMRLTELAEEAGIPPGVWNVVNGGREVVGALLDHQDIAGITFVGSTPVAKIVYERCGAKQKRVIAQGGAKNFMVVMPDCNIKKTAAALMTSFFGNTGQRCLAGENLLVVGDDAFYKEFMEEVVSMASRIVIGYGLDESVQMGPLASKDKKESVLEFIESGLKEGAEFLLDGREFIIKGEYPKDSFLGATIFKDVTMDMKIAREEIFGPVMNVLRAKNLQEAITMCNTSSFGNGNAIFTSSGESARRFKYEVVSGNIGVNIGIAAPTAQFPFSGMRDSFYGVLHTQGQEAIRFFTESKVIIERWF